MAASFDAAGRVRRQLFPTVPTRPARIGAEVELLSLDVSTLRPVDVASRILPFLAGRASALGGVMREAGKGGTRVMLPGGGAIAIEPGGQIEYASPPFESPAALLHQLDVVLLPLVAAAADAGIRLVGAGIDPYNPLGEAPLQVTAPRYCRMDAYFASIGPAGARMMRQTAAVQVNVDAGADAYRVWRTLQAATPIITALFANSRWYASKDSGMASARAENWRAVDPMRSGLVADRSDPAAEYARFALGAPVMRPHPGGGYRPFGDWLRSGDADEALWADHLSTMFPEVRPRGYFEVRCIDAQPPDRLAAPVCILAGMTLDPYALDAAADLLGVPDRSGGPSEAQHAPAESAPHPAADLLRTAGRAGLRDERIAARARDLIDIALGGCRRLGPVACDPDVLEEVALQMRLRLGAGTLV